MRIAIGSDHRGVKLRSELNQWLQLQGYEVLDQGTSASNSVDYPDLAQLVAQAVSNQQADCGILICGTGIGMQIAANKLPRIRAAAIWDAASAEVCKRHNDVNVLCLGERFSEDQARKLVKVWLETEFEGGRHARRIEKIRQLEACQENSPSS